MGLVVAAVLLVVSAWREVLALQRRRAAQARWRSATAAVRAVSAELRSGGRPDAALDSGREAAGDGAVGEALAAAASACRVGVDAGPALSAVPELRGMAAAWRMSERAGAPLADVLCRVATALATRDGQARRVSALVAGARASTATLAVLPVLGLLAGSGMGADPVRVLVSTPIGQACCAIGATFEAAGLAWMRRLVRVAER
jgi:tight adherence protein B